MPSGPRSNSPAPPSYPTFSSILEADHAQINRLAQRLKNALARLAAAAASPTPSPQKRELEAAAVAIRDEIIWRLIRHDISEEIVMRPAFVEYMGEAGKGVVEGDRKDHNNAKPELLKLMSMSLYSAEYAPFVESMMADLAEHMKRESGNEIPQLESVLSRSTSRELAKRYARTQLLTPDLRVERDEKGDLRLAFTSLEGYVLAPIERFRELLQLLPGDGEEGSIDGGNESEVERRKSRL